jgi:uncharacterized membrane protein
VTFTDWLLFFHVISAFSLVAALTVFWTLVLAGRKRSVLPGETAEAIARPANVLVIIGVLGTVVFGIWLAIKIDGYELWDGWILASLILWAISSGLGQRSGVAFTRYSKGGPDADQAWREGLRFHVGTSVVVLVILILMIWKPGA